MSSGSQLVVQMGSDEAKLWAGLQKIIDQQKKMEGGFGKVAKEAKKAEKDISGMGTAGKELISQATSIATSWLSIGSVIGIATSALNGFQELQEKAKKTADDLANSRRELNQIATSPEQLIEFNQRSDALAAKYGVSRENVRNLQANAANFGFTDDVGFLEKAVAAEGANIASAAVMGQTGGKLSSLFNGEITPAQAVNAAFTAAQSSELTFEAMAPALPVAAASGVPAGAKPEEVIAGVSVLSKKFKSAEMASERYSRVVSEMRKDDDLAGIMQKQGFNAALEKIKNTPGLKDSAAGESMEAKQGLEAMLATFDTIKTETAKIKQAIADTGTERDAITRQMGIVQQADKMTGGAGGARQSAKAAEQAGLQANEESNAAIAFRKKAALDIIGGVRATSGAPGLVQGLDDVAGGLLSPFYSVDALERKAAAASVRARTQKETGSSDQAIAAQSKFASEATQADVAAELRRAAAELSAASTALKAGASANGANLQRQASSFAEK